jgi:hypothetical protein
MASNVPGKEHAISRFRGRALTGLCWTIQFGPSAGTDQEVGSIATLQRSNAGAKSHPSTNQRDACPVDAYSLEISRSDQSMSANESSIICLEEARATTSGSNSFSGALHHLHQHYSILRLEALYAATDMRTGEMQRRPMRARDMRRSAMDAVEHIQL